MDVSLWLEFAHAAETAGRDITAREAYAQASRLLPANAEIAKSLRAVDERPCATAGCSRRPNRSSAGPVTG